jgi:hypothetical protein
MIDSTFTLFKFLVHSVNRPHRYGRPFGPKGTWPALKGDYGVPWPSKLWAWVGTLDDLTRLGVLYYWYPWPENVHLNQQSWPLTSWPIERHRALVLLWTFLATSLRSKSPHPITPFQKINEKFQFYSSLPKLLIHKHNLISTVFSICVNCVTKVFIIRYATWTFQFLGTTFKVIEFTR